MSARGWRRFQASATVAWFLLIVPTVIWWRESILWIALISCYANAGTHFSAWQAARAETGDASGDDAAGSSDSGR